MAMDQAPGDEPAEAPSPALSISGGQTRVPAHLEKLADHARDYVEAASAANTRRAYATDWKHFGSWCRRKSVEVFPPDPQVVGLYITLAHPARPPATRRQILCRRSNAGCPL